jgi:hypothetical protein
LSKADTFNQLKELDLKNQTTHTHTHTHCIPTQTTASVFLDQPASQPYKLWVFSLLQSCEPVPYNEHPCVSSLSVHKGPLTDASTEEISPVMLTIKMELGGSQIV